MRTIKSLINPQNHVYVFFRNEDICRRFLIQAENEGFVFGQNRNPTEINPTDIIAILPSNQLCYLGFVSRMAFQSNQKNITRIDYEKYISGDKSYIV